MGDVALGIITVSYYDYNSQLTAQPRVCQSLQRRISSAKFYPDILSIGGYDGMHLIYEALKKTDGKTDGNSLIAAAKGMIWESPRGLIGIDPDTRDVVETVYFRRVEKVGDSLRNVEFDKVGRGIRQKCARGTDAAFSAPAIIP